MRTAKRSKTIVEIILFNIVGISVIILVLVLRKINIYVFMYPDAFGPQSLSIEYYARKILLLSSGKRYTMISFDKGTRVPNKALREHHIESGLIIVNSNLLTKILRCGLTVQKELVKKRSFNINAFMTANMTSLQIDPDLYIDSKMALPFNDCENKNIDKVLSEMSLSNAEFYLFQDRNLEYHKKTYPSKSHDNSMFNNGRTQPVEDFELAAKTMYGIGINAVRVGSESKPINYPSNIIDYPNTYRSKLGDFADLALMDRCKFCFSESSGIGFFAKAFDKPLLLNAYPWPWMHVPMKKNSVSMPKKLWMIDKKRMMTLQEMIKMESDFDYKKMHYDRDFFKSLKIEVINNDSEEIMQAILEINSRIDGTWNGVDYKLSDILKNNIGGKSHSVLSTSFADLNKDIMGDLYQD
jgi:putative glycosyltransferase (TIGR04372 family)